MIGVVDVLYHDNITIYVIDVVVAIVVGTVHTVAGVCVFRLVLWC